uniref:Si:dkeyp-97e7.9 n=1 Tax=Cyprinus carpio TaxID=7962 RepID=A0A8C1XLL0_CYPCA
KLGTMFKVLVTRIKRQNIYDSKLIKDCRHHLRKYPNCSVAQGRTYPLEVPDRESAVHQKQRWPVFKDAKLYRFRKDDSTFPFNIEVNVFMHGQRMYEQLLQLRQEKGVAYEPSFPGYMLIDWLNVISAVNFLLMLCLAETLHSSFHSAVSLKHHFFDSGLLYQFCINFRRWRCLSELLHETENEEVECITHQSQEDQADSPFTLYKTPPCEGNSYFLSDSKIITNTTTIFQPTSSIILGDALGWGFVVRGKSPCYVQAVDPGSPAVAAGFVCQFVCQVNGRSVLHLDYCTLSKVVMTGPRVVLNVKPR